MTLADEIAALNRFADELEIKIIQCRPVQAIDSPVNLLDVKYYVKLCVMRSDCLHARNVLAAVKLQVG